MITVQTASNVWTQRFSEGKAVETMSVQKALIVRDAWEFGYAGEINDNPVDALVRVDDGMVTISPHDSDRGGVVTFSRDDFAEIAKMVNSVPSSAGSAEGKA